MKENKIAKIIIIIISISFAQFLIPTIFMVIYMMKESENNIKINPIIILIGLSFIIIIWGIIKYNEFTCAREKVKQARSGIDIYLQQRFDLIPNLVETVKAHSNYERETIESIISLKNQYESRNKESIKESEILCNRYTNLLALIESYPELNSNQSYLNLQKALQKIESQLQAVRRIYNTEVTEYNIIISKMPGVLIAKLFNFKEQDLFQITDNKIKDNNEIEIF